MINYLILCVIVEKLLKSFLNDAVNGDYNADEE